MTVLANTNHDACFHIKNAGESKLNNSEWSFILMFPVRGSTSNLQLLSELLLTPSLSSGSRQQSAIPATSTDYPSRIAEKVKSLQQSSFEELKHLAETNHVIMRSFAMLVPILETAGNRDGAQWFAFAIKAEQARIDHALDFLVEICATLERGGCPSTVIKSLDHWPDLGCDLDLFTDAEAARVVELMSTRFGAILAERSWGDRLANKWNFIVPGLPEQVEVHIGRLGQTGEQTALTRSLSERTCMTTVGRHSFRVPAPEDRFVISTLQRMYRHFYIRLCDIVDNAHLLDEQMIDFAYLHSLGSLTGLWEGVATYMRIISEYVSAYRGHGVPLPSLVSRSAKFGVDKVQFRRNFLRVPILPHSLHLYAGELKTLVLRGELRNSLRLSLLPGLATAAALEQKITGSDKGIW